MTDPRHQPVPLPPGSTPTPTPTPTPSAAGSPVGPTSAWPATPAWPAQSGPTTGGRRRTPGWVIALAITTAVLSVVAFTTVLLWPTSTGGASGPLQFHAFAQVARVAYDQPSSTSFTRIVGDRVYVAWEQDDDLMVVAAGLADGAELWRQLVTGSPRWGELFALPNAAMVVGADRGGANHMYMLDGGGGALLWQREVGPDDWVTAVGEHLVWFDAENERLQGLAIATGDESWSQQMSGDSVSLWALAEEDLARPTDTEGYLGVISTDHRLVVVEEEQAAYVVDGRNGTVISQGANLAGTRDRLLAYDGRLYVAAEQGGFQLLSYDLDNLGGLPRTHYLAGPDRHPEALAACGPERVCLLETEGSARSTTELVAVDTVEDRGQLWRQPAPDAQRMLVVGEWVTVAGFDLPVRGFDAEGVEVLNRPGTVARLDGQNLLAFTDDLDDFRQDLNVTGMAVTGESTTELTELGHLADVVGSQCAWESIYLVCPDREGATIWRFAEEP